ncbi:hypothetical protein CDLVIII_2140 [Clostridium sp. DL-VIII]|uniref:hypothetical protein n=1 Tax=Clostridium sp. DL-VIII TaxID=641107 RepID=UPI00023AFAE8|nr:hypothetical protein [Clostridium sp. DL-VIII]EHI98803.1 hypothetical protein CDLVIII_2140 [Clostridium sp. DL-VIII]
MTILDLLSRMNTGNNSMEKALEIIKDDFISLINDNYELVVNEKKELNVKIPSLEKRDEYVYDSITEYPYPLVMCMRIQEVKNVEVYNLILSRFMEFYKDKLDLFLKDVNSVDKLKENIVRTKRHIDNTTYASIFVGVIGAIILCVFKLSETARYMSILGIILFFILALILQVTKENQVKKVIDAYLSIIKTEWYKKELYKQYAFFCNFIEQD